MLVSEIITRVRNTAGDLNVLQFTDDQLLLWINDAVREIAVENKLSQKTASLSCISGQQGYALPDDILKMHSVYVDGEKIQVSTLQEWETLFSGGGNDTRTARPSMAYVWAGKLNLWPTPGEAYSLKINYIYDPVDSLNPAMVPPIPVAYHLRIVSYCLAQVALQDENTDKYSLHMQEFNTGIVSLKHGEESQEDLYPFMAVSARDMGDGYGVYEW